MRVGCQFECHLCSGDEVAQKRLADISSSKQPMLVLLRILAKISTFRFEYLRKTLHKVCIIYEVPSTKIRRNSWNIHPSFLGFTSTPLSPSLQVLVVRMFEV